MANEINGNRRKTMLSFLFFLILALLIFVVYWFFFLRNKVGTDDAYVNGYAVSLTSEVSAITTAFYADNSDFVKKGDLLVQLDKTDFTLALEKAKANLALSVRQVVTLQQNVLEAKASLNAQRQRYQKAMIDFENRQGLVDSLAVTQEDFSHSKIAMNLEKALLSLYKHRLNNALASLGNTDLNNHPQVVEAKTMLRQAYINLTRTDIYAPVDGFIAKRSIEVGKWVNPKDLMLAIISLDDVFVDANFKETQISDIRVGQPVELISDIYGRSMNFQGTVFGLVPGTGSFFSLLPPQNATGNWIKIVQRIPVRILLDREEIKQNPLLLGLSMYATVNTSDTSGHFLREISQKKAIMSTNIYHVSLEDVDRLIDEIIAENAGDGIK